MVTPGRGGRYNGDPPDHFAPVYALDRFDNGRAFGVKQSRFARVCPTMKHREPRSRAPWHFRMAKHLIRQGWRGPGRVIRGAHRLGLLNCVVRYSLTDSLTVDVPLYRPENWWDAD